MTLPAEQGILNSPVLPLSQKADKAELATLIAKI